MFAKQPLRNQRSTTGKYTLNPPPLPPKSEVASVQLENVITILIGRVDHALVVHGGDSRVSVSRERAIEFGHQATCDRDTVEFDDRGDVLRGAIDHAITVRADLETDQ